MGSMRKLQFTALLYNLLIHGLLKTVVKPMQQLNLDKTTRQLFGMNLISQDFHIGLSRQPTESEKRNCEIDV